MNALDSMLLNNGQPDCSIIYADLNFLYYTWFRPCNFLFFCIDLGIFHDCCLLLLFLANELYDIIYNFNDRYYLLEN